VLRGILAGDHSPPLDQLTPEDVAAVTEILERLSPPGGERL
jgi:hypothetical protein